MSDEGASYKLTLCAGTAIIKWYLCCLFQEGPVFPPGWWEVARNTVVTPEALKLGESNTPAFSLIAPRGDVFWRQVLA